MPSRPQVKKKQRASDKVMGTVVDMNASRERAKHKRKEEKFDSLQKRFEKALPTDEPDPKQKLLDLFKKK
jgi:hypothetical protein